MANTIGWDHSETGVQLDAFIFNASKQVWNGSAFVTRAVASWNSYRVPMTETPSASYHYEVAFPAGITGVGVYMVQVRRRAAGSVGSAVVTDGTLAEGEVFWDGVLILDQAEALRLIRAKALASINITEGGVYQLKDIRSGVVIGTATLAPSPPNAASSGSGITVAS